MQRFENLPKNDQKRIMRDYRKAIAKVHARINANLRKPMVNIPYAVAGVDRGNFL
jgi:hypothetical protein